MEDKNRSQYPTKVCWAAIFCLFSPLLICACQPPKECDTTYEPSNIDTASLLRFDTDVDSFDNVNALCYPNDTRFDNRFSPYKGGSVSVDLIVEHFSFFGCPHCADFAKYVDRMLSNPQIENRVRFYFHHYMFTRYEMIHLGAFAASQQGMDKFWQMHDRLFATVNVEYTYQSLRDYAMFQLQLEMPLYDNLMSPATDLGSTAIAYLNEEKKIANANCIHSTPSVYICGELVHDWRDSEDIILKYLKTEK